MNPTSRSVGFTIPNYSIEDLRHLEEEHPKIKFLKVAEEIGEEGLPHLQGYAQGHQAMRLSQWKTILRPENPQSIHLEFRIVNAQAMIRYVGLAPGTMTSSGVKKGEVLSVFFYGDPPAGKGSRSDLSLAQEMIDLDGSEERVAIEMFSTWARNYRSLEKYAQRFSSRARVARRTPRVAPAKVVAIWGEAVGTGKSVLARKLGELFSSQGKSF